VGSREGRSVFKAKPLGRNVGSRGCDWSRSSRANTVWTEIGHADCTSNRSQFTRVFVLKVFFFGRVVTLKSTSIQTFQSKWMANHGCKALVMWLCSNLL
jgi:hypothetical protein